MAGIYRQAPAELYMTSKKSAKDFLDELISTGKLQPCRETAPAPCMPSPSLSTSEEKKFSYTNKNSQKPLLIGLLAVLLVAIVVLLVILTNILKEKEDEGLQSRDTSGTVESSLPDAASSATAESSPESMVSSETTAPSSTQASESIEPIGQLVEDYTAIKAAVVRRITFLDLSYMFGGCSSLTKLDVSNFDTSCVTNMEGMFCVTTNLTSLDVSGLDTSQVTNMYAMFHQCPNLTTPDFGSWDVSAVSNYAYFMDEGKQINGKPWEDFFQPS